MRRSRWAVAGMVAAAVAVGGVVNAAESTYLASGWHTVQRGEEGGDVTVGNFQVHVHGATTSDRLENGAVVTSPGTFVVVELSYATTDAWDTPEQVALLDGAGREFTEATGFGSDGRVWAAGPDIWFRGQLLFEVPAGTVADLTLEFRPEFPDPQRPATLLQVPLTVQTAHEPLTLERASALAAGDR